MNITRLYADNSGETHFEQLRVPLTESGKIGMLSDKETATGVVFRTTGADYDYDWHCAPARQYVVMLEGRVELEVSDGEKRELGPGEILLVEDTWGKGHPQPLPGRPGATLDIHYTGVTQRSF